MLLIGYYLFCCKLDLSEVQRELAENNHRYELVGERLADRQGQLEEALSGLKCYLTDVQQLMVYLNEVEPQVGNTPNLLMFCTRNYRLHKNGSFCKRTEASKVIAGVKVKARALPQKESIDFSCIFACITTNHLS